MDLLSSTPFWPVRDGLPAAFPPLEGHAECEVAVIGGGIAGALLAHRLAAAGCDVVLLDRREVAHGSTAGNTGLLLYELDVPLVRLERQIGADRARRAWRRCRDAVRGVEQRIRALALACDFERRPSLYVAARRRHVAALRRECLRRREIGLDAEWWDGRTIARRSSLPHPAGILSPDAAQLDVYRLAYGLLAAAQRRGARIHDRTEVTDWRATRGGVTLRTARGGRVRARHLVVATGYEAEEILPAPPGRLRSTFALVTEPVAGLPGWPANGCMIWDTADPYLYLRTTGDGRVLIGGLDEAVSAGRARDRLLPGKTRLLQRRLQRLFPDLRFEVAMSWAGTFGISADGLPFIGRHPRHPGVWLALGFGGNGTTFGLVAADIIAAGIRGERDPDADVFGFERRKAGR